MLALQPRVSALALTSSRNSKTSRASTTTTRISRAVVVAVQAKSSEQEASTTTCSSPSMTTSTATMTIQQIGRRRALAAAAAAAVSIAYVRPPFSVAETTQVSTTSASVSASSPPSPPSPPPPSVSTSVSTSAPERFEAAEFSLTVPAGFDLVEVARPGYAPTTAEERGARGRGVAAQESPVKVRFTASSALSSPSSASSPSSTSSTSTSSSTAELSVIAREAAGIKPTFLQVTDISQWGDPAAVAALLLPRGVTVTSASREVVELPARDTGTVAGIVAPPPQAVYLYEFFDNPRGGGGGGRGQTLHVTLAAAARSGKIFVAAGSARGDEAWAARAEGLREAVRSFRVTPPLR